MSKLVKIILGILGALVLIIAGAYYVFIMPVSAKTVCGNFFKVYKEELSAKTKINYEQAQLEQVSGMTMDKCISDTNDRMKKSTKGLIYIAKRSKCEAAAKSVSEFDKCKNIQTR